MSILLMIVTIIGVIGFQVYWVNKSYEEEKQTLRVQTNILFREAVFQSHAKKLNIDTARMDTSVKMRQPSPGTLRIVSALQKRARDTLLSKVEFNARVPSEGRLSYPHIKDSFVQIRLDSGRVRKMFSTSLHGQKTVIQILETAESLQDSVTTKEVEDEYRKLLAREKIVLPFTITRIEGIRRDEMVPPDLAESNEVSLGFLKPVTFRVDLRNTTGYIMRKLLPTILISFLLIALTLLSFVLLFRNLIR